MASLRSRLRHREPTRLDALIDAIFAFAITLLILWNDRLPNDFASLVALFGSIPSFAVSFGLITLFWWQQVKWSRQHRVDDRFTTVISLALVFVVLIYVFPLRIMFSVFFSWITGGFLPTPFEDTVDINVLGLLFVTYGLAFALMSACICALYWRAWTTRLEHEPTAESAARAAEGRAVYAYFVAVALASVALTGIFLLVRVSEGWIFSIAGWLYCLLFFTGMVEAWAHRRALRRAKSDGLPEAATLGPADAAASEGYDDPAEEI
jgi:uncharacterized membrane protein